MTSKNRKIKTRSTFNSILDRLYFSENYILFLFFRTSNENITKFYDTLKRLTYSEDTEIDLISIEEIISCWKKCGKPYDDCDDDDAPFLM